MKEVKNEKNKVENLKAKKAYRREEIYAPFFSNISLNT